MYERQFYPIMIDEEEASFRLSNLFSTREFSQYFLEKFMKKNKKRKLIYRYYLDTICNILNDLGININYSVMDLLQKSTHEIIKERAYSDNLKTVKTLGKFCISLLKEKKLLRLLNMHQAMVVRLLIVTKNSP